MKLINYFEVVIDEKIKELYDFDLQLDIKKNLFDYIDLFCIIKYVTSIAKEFFKKNNVSDQNIYDLKLQAFVFSKDEEMYKIYQKLQIIFEDFLKSDLNINLDDILKKPNYSFRDEIKNKIVAFIKDNDILKKMSFEKLSFEISEKFTIEKYSTYQNSYRNIQGLFNSLFHDYIFHSMSEINSVNKFDNEDAFGNFDNPYGYDPIEMFKELQAIQTNFISTTKSRSDRKNTSLILNNIKKSIYGLKKDDWGKNDPDITWKQFRDTFKGYDTFLKLFPKKNFPDNKDVDFPGMVDELIEDAYENSKDFFYRYSDQQNLPGFSRKNQLDLSKMYPKYDDKINKFESVQRIILRHVAPFIKSSGKNEVYINKINN